MPFVEVLDSLLFFGSYPIQEEIELLEQRVDMMVDLTHAKERKNNPYSLTTLPVFHLPIKDYSYPQDWTIFSQFIIFLCDKLASGTRIFIHCRAGHGRSSLVCASILCYRDKVHPENAIQIITERHGQRELSESWTLRSNPLSRRQKFFLYKFFSAIAFSKSFISGVQAGFSVFSPHPVVVNDIEFPEAEAVYQYLKNPENAEYVEALKESKTGMHSKLIIGEEDTSQHPDPLEAMVSAYRLKYQQHPELWEPLLNTRLRPLYDFCKYSHADNLVGRALMRLREERIMETLEFIFSPDAPMV